MVEPINTKQNSNTNDQLLTEKREKIREGIRTCYREYIIPRENIDPSLIKLEEAMNEANAEILRRYGRVYEPPQIIYVDFAKAFSDQDEIQDRIEATGYPDIIGPLSADGLYDGVGNYCLIFMHKFDDALIDAFQTGIILRHELGHAIGINKNRHRVIDDKPSLVRYKAGGIFQRQRGSKELFGVLVDEGQNAITDRVFDTGKTIYEDKALKRLPNIDSLFPGARQRYERLKSKLREEGKLPQDEGLRAYIQISGDIYIKTFPEHGYYHYFANLLDEMYRRDPSLFQAVRDYIYGDRIFPMARKIEMKFGKRFLLDLMAAQTDDDAAKLFEELKQIPEQ